jgi:hypothetical protein
VIDDLEGNQSTHAERARSVAYAVTAMLTAQARFNRLQDDELLRGRTEPERRAQQDAIAAAGRALRGARARARFARGMWWSWQTEHGQADGMAVR